MFEHWNIWKWEYLRREYQQYISPVRHLTCIKSKAANFKRAQLTKILTQNISHCKRAQLTKNNIFKTAVTAPYLCVKGEFPEIHGATSSDGQSLGIRDSAWLKIFSLLNDLITLARNSRKMLAQLYSNAQGSLWGKNPQKFFKFLVLSHIIIIIAESKSSPSSSSTLITIGSNSDESVGHGNLVKVRVLSIQEVCVWTPNPR